MINSSCNWKDIGSKKRLYNNDLQSSSSLLKHSQKYQPENKSGRSGSGSKPFKISTFNHSNSVVIRQNKLNTSKESNSPIKPQILITQVQQNKMVDLYPGMNLLLKGQFQYQRNKSGFYSQLNSPIGDKYKQDYAKAIKKIQLDFSIFKDKVFNMLKIMEENMNKTFEYMLIANQKQIQNFKNKLIDVQLLKRNMNIKDLQNLQILSPVKKKNRLQQSKSMNSNQSNNFSTSLFNASKQASNQGSQPTSKPQMNKNSSQFPKKQSFNKFLLAIKMLKQDINQMTLIGRQNDQPNKPVFKGFNHSVKI